MTTGGVYSLQSGLEDSKRVALVAQRIADDKEDRQTTSRPSTFSDQGIVRDITLIQGEYTASAIWFHPRLATHYEPIYGDGDPSFRNDDYLTYVYRLDGKVKERLEPVRRVEDRPDVMEEWLYLHWQEEKKKGESAVTFWGYGLMTDDRMVFGDSDADCGGRLDHADARS